MCVRACVSSRAYQCACSRVCYCKTQLHTHTHTHPYYLHLSQTHPHHPNLTGQPFCFKIITHQAIFTTFTLLHGSSALLHADARVFRIPSFRTKSSGQRYFTYQAPVISLSLFVFFFAPACEIRLIKTYSIESRCVIGPENILFPGAPLHFITRNFYRL